jgi:hypothetical protein
MQTFRLFRVFVDSHHQFSELEWDETDLTEVSEKGFIEAISAALNEAETSPGRKNWDTSKGQEDGLVLHIWRKARDVSHGQIKIAGVLPAEIQVTEIPTSTGKVQICEVSF